MSREPLTLTTPIPGKGNFYTQYEFDNFTSSYGEPAHILHITHNNFVNHVNLL